MKDAYQSPAKNVDARLVFESASEARRPGFGRT